MSRGGAGNILQIEEMRKRQAGDIEANRGSVGTARSQGLQDEEPTKSSEQNYAHMGRGGAGNWYSPQTLASTGSFVTPDAKPKPSQPQQQSDNQIPAKHHGRGGAGNLLFRGADEKAKQEALEKEAKLQEMIAKHVEAGLARPGKAVVKGPEI